MQLRICDPISPAVAGSDIHATIQRLRGPRHAVTWKNSGHCYRGQPGRMHAHNFRSSGLIYLDKTFTHTSNSDRRGRSLSGSPADPRPCLMRAKGQGADSGPSSSNNSVRTNPTSPSPSQKPAQASAWGEAPSSPLRDVPIRQVDSNIVKGDGPVRPGKQAVDPPTIKKVVQEEGEGLPTVCPWGTGTLVTVMGYYVCLALVLGVGGTSLSAALTGTTMEAMTARDKALALLSCQTLQGAGVALILRSCLQEFAPLPPQWFHWRVPSVGQVASVAGGGITLFVACAAAISLTGVEAEATRQASVQQLVSSSDVTTELATVVGICMVTPLLEEVVFRGFFLASLGTMVSPWSAVALSSLAFATCHFNPAEFPMLFLMGLVFGGLYARSGNLAAPVMAHAAWNGLILFATFWVQQHVS